MKIILLSMALTASVSLSHAADIIFSGRRDDESFKRVSEYFDAKENPGRYTIIRTDPSQRNGYYVILKLNSEDQPKKSASARIQFVKPGTLEIESQTIAVEPIKKNRVIIGLTDGIWASSRTLPTAWKIEFLDANGSVLSSAQSFLWSSKPSAS